MTDLFSKPFGEGGNFGRRILTPSRLCARVQEVFDGEFGTVWVEGEVAELSLPRSGHAYFSLKEAAGGQEVRVKAVMWKGRRLGAGAALAEGQMVLARGRLAVYAPRGDFQLVVDYLEPKGEGALRLAFEKLKVRLTGEGLFDEARKRPLPFWPKRVAVISSSSGAAVRDFIQTGLRRRPRAAISLYPVLVQGPGASREIVEALADLNAWGGFDLIVLTRGGGSLSDLWAFNEEAVVRAVAASRTVTLAAIGHSTDLSLAEMAADQRAITPTAAAEAVFRDQAALVRHVGGLETALARCLTGIVERRRERLEYSRRRLERGLSEVLNRRRHEINDLIRRLERFKDRLDRSGQRLDGLTVRLAGAAAALMSRRAAGLEAAGRSLRFRSPAVLIEGRNRELAALDGRLGRAVRERLAAGRSRLDHLEARLKDLSPENILRRGYALVTKGPKRTPVTGAAALAVGDEVEVRLADGGFTSTIRTIEGRS